MNDKSRRNFLRNTGIGLGGAAFSGFIPGIGGISSAFAADLLEDPLAPKAPHFPAKIKSVIWLHQNGAPSTLDLFDYKPDLVKHAGKPVPQSFLTGIKTSTQGGVNQLWASNRQWKNTAKAALGFQIYCQTSRSTRTKLPLLNPA